MLLNSFRMDENTMKKYVQTINQYGPDIIQAYAGSIYELARFIKKKGLFLLKQKLFWTEISAGDVHEQGWEYVAKKHTGKTLKCF